jgi:hypothetical protein
MHCVTGHVIRVARGLAVASCAAWNRCEAALGDAKRHRSAMVIASPDRERAAGVATPEPLTHGDTATAAGH